MLLGKDAALTVGYIRHDGFENTKPRAATMLYVVVGHVALLLALLIFAPVMTTAVPLAAAPLVTYLQLTPLAKQDDPSIKLVPSANATASSSTVRASSSQSIVAAEQSPADPLGDESAPASVEVAQPALPISTAAQVPEPPPASPPRFDAAYLQNPAPAYPALSKRLKEIGRVLLSVHVSREGSALSVDVLSSSGFSRLDEAAVTAVRRWRFVPAQQGGRAIAAVVTVPIEFSLNTSTTQ